MFTPIPLDDFAARTGIRARALADAWHGAERLVSLRDIATVTALQAMPIAYLEALLRNVTIAGDPNVRPYAACRIDQLRMDPQSLAVGQTFIERGKYRALLEEFPALFAGFSVTRGPAKCTAYVVAGVAKDGSPVIAHYLPPIIEEHGNALVLLDGVHRNFLIGSVGTTIETLVLRGVATPFPADTRGWDAVMPVDEKPPKDQRYFNLRPDLFRDLKHIGIDG